MMKWKNVSMAMLGAVAIGGACVQRANTDGTGIEDNTVKTGARAADDSVDAVSVQGAVKRGEGAGRDAGPNATRRNANEKQRERGASDSIAAASVPSPANRDAALGQDAGPADNATRRIAQVLYFLPDDLEAFNRDASRADMTMSKYSFYAWSMVRDSILKTKAPLCSGESKRTRHKQILYFRPKMHDELVAESKRLGCSRSFMVLEVWRRAQDKMRVFE